MGKELTYGTGEWVRDLRVAFLPGVSHWVQQEVGRSFGGSRGNDPDPGSAKGELRHAKLPGDGVPRCQQEAGVRGLTHADVPEKENGSPCSK